ncbi:MAG: insulinase family protein [Myxococcota bacterium]
MLWLPLVNFLVGMASPAFAEIAIFRFESGLRVVVEHQPATPWVATALTFGSAGEADVAPGQEHLAHLVEHLWFRAGEPLPHDLQLSALGCEWQAFTWPRTMDFLTTCPADVLPQQLDLEVAKLQGRLAGLDDTMVGLARDVVAIEVAAYRETEETAITRTIASQMARSLAIRERLVRQGLGEDLSPATVQDFVAQHLTPEQAVLAVVSPTPLSELRPLLEARFGRVVSTAPEGPAPAGEEPRRATLRPDVRTVDASVPRPLVVVSWEMPEVLIRSGSALTGWLEQALVERLPGETRIETLGCLANAAVSVPTVSCVAYLAAHVDPARLARELRPRLDVRKAVSKGLVADAFVEGEVRRLLSEVSNLDELAPGPLNRPAVLAHGMLQSNRLARFAPLEASRKVRRALKQAAEEAFDPLRAHVLAVRPVEPSVVLPSARPAPDALEWAVPALPTVATLVDVPALVRPTFGGLSIDRPDFAVTRVLTIGGDGRVDVDVWFGEPLPELADGASRIFVGREVPAMVESEGTASEPPTESASVTAGLGLTSLRWMCEPTSPAVLFVARELLQQRAWSSLRVRTAWSYYVGVSAFGGRLSLDAEVLPDAAEPAVEALRSAIAQLADEPVPPYGLAIARRRALISGSAGLALPLHWPALVTAEGRLRSPGELTDLPGAIRKVDSTDIQSLYQACREAEIYVIPQTSHTTPERRTPPEESP